jgi:hypothetical protein
MVVQGVLKNIQHIVSYPSGITHGFSLNQHLRTTTEDIVYRIFVRNMVIFC